MRRLTPEETKLISGSSRTTSTSPPIVVTGSPPPPIVVTGSPPPPIVVTGSPPPPIVVTGGGGGGSGNVDPYAPDFDCAAATQQQRDFHNTLVSEKRIADSILAMGAGQPGGSSGYDNIEYVGFGWRDANGVNHISPLSAGGPTSAGFLLTSSVAGQPVDQVTINGVNIPITQITTFVHNHPSNSATNQQGAFPLPSTPRIENGVMVGDYYTATLLDNLGADGANLQIGILGESVKGGGYNLRTYYQNWDPSNPPFDPNDPSTWAAAYGPTIPSLTYC